MCYFNEFAFCAMDVCNLPLCIILLNLPSVPQSSVHATRLQIIDDSLVSLTPRIALCNVSFF